MDRDWIGLDDLRIDPQRRRVMRRRQVIALPSLSFNTLMALVEAAPEPLSAEALIERAWQGAVVGDDAVIQRIRLLRQALGDDPREPRYIDTVRNEGYRLVPPVRRGLPGTSARVWRWGAMATAVFILAAAGLWLARTAPVHAPDPGPEPVATVPAGPVTAEELARGASEYFSQRSRAGMAHAVALYEQALELDPDNPRIQSSLALVLALSVAWHNEPHALAHRAEALARRALETSQTSDAELALAMSLDVQGRMRPAEAAYERALALNPDHWGIRASLAYSYQVGGRLVEALSYNIEAMNVAPSGRLDVQVASCLRLLGFSDIASNWLERAERLNPASVHAAPMLALDLIGRGERQRAGEVIDRALARGVAQNELYVYRAVLALLADDRGAAMRVLEQVPEHLQWRGDVKTWRRVLEAVSGNGIEAAIALARDYRQDVAEGDDWPDVHLHVALLETAAGRNQAALDALEEMARAGYRDTAWLEALPVLDALHGHPRFQAVVAGMRADVDRQRAQVLTAAWLPPELRRVAATSTPPAG